MLLDGINNLLGLKYRAAFSVADLMCKSWGLWANTRSLYTQDGEGFGHQNMYEVREPVCQAIICGDTWDLSLKSSLCLSFGQPH